MFEQNIIIFLSLRGVEEFSLFLMNLLIRQKEQYSVWKSLSGSFTRICANSGLYIARYLSYVMDVATPTADCLTLVHDLLLPVILRSRSKNSLSHQEVICLHNAFVLQILSFSCNVISRMRYLLKRNLSFWSFMHITCIILF